MDQHKLGSKLLAVNGLLAEKDWFHLQANLTITEHSRKSYSNQQHTCKLISIIEYTVAINTTVYQFLLVETTWLTWLHVPTEDWSSSSQ